MPFVNIRIVKQVIADDSERKKTEIAKKVATAIADTAGIPEDVVWVVFEEVDEADWFVGHTRVKELRAQS